MSKRTDMVEKTMLLCAIPHWFDEEILRWVTGKELQSSARTQALLSDLTGLVFVEHNDRGQHRYHRNVRIKLLSRWREDTRLFRKFQKISGKMAAYYEDKLQKDIPSEEQRAEWGREEMYHLFVSDEGRGIGLFINLVNRASQLYQLSTFQLLLDLANEQAVNISISNRSWIQFYEGELAWLTGNWPETIRIWEALEKQDQKSTELVKALAEHLSFLYKDKGEWDKATRSFENCLEILKKSGDERGMAATFNNLGFLYKDKEQWQDADECFERSLVIMTGLNDERGMAKILNNQGLLYKDQGDKDRAGECFRRGLEILKSSADESQFVDTLNNLGFLYKDWGKWEEAEMYFRRVLEIFEKNGDEIGRAATLKNLGFLYTGWKKWDEAYGCLKRSQEILERLDDKRGVANTYSYLGFLYRDHEKWDEAAACFQCGVDLLYALGDEHGAATVFGNLGFLYKQKGDDQKSIDYFQRGLTIFEKIGDEMNTATALYQLALLYENMQQYDGALTALTKVITIYDHVGHPDLAVRRSRELLENIRIKAAAGKSAAEKGVR